MVCNQPRDPLIRRRQSEAIVLVPNGSGGDDWEVGGAFGRVIEVFIPLKVQVSLAQSYLTVDVDAGDAALYSLDPSFGSVSHSLQPPSFSLVLMCIIYFYTV